MRGRGTKVRKTNRGLNGSRNFAKKNTIRMRKARQERVVNMYVLFFFREQLGEKRNAEDGSSLKKKTMGSKR